MTENKIEKPEIVTDEHLLFLDYLKKSEKINMYAATPRIVKEFGVGRPDARLILKYWMKTFSERTTKT